MSRSESSRRAVPPWLANLLLLVVSLVFALAGVEIAVRAFVDLERAKPFGVCDIDHANGGLSFLPG